MPSSLASLDPLLKYAGAPTTSDGIKEALIQLSFAS